MKKNIISIDLDKVVHLDREEITSLYEHAIVPTPCTLTDAVEKYQIKVYTSISGDRICNLNNKQDVEHFKENHLYKEDKDLNYWKENAEEDYKQTPISVLRYISELEQKLEK